MAFDPEAIATCFRRRYELLGWSDDELAVDQLRALGRSENVIHLLRRMPFLRQDLHDEKWELYEETRPLSYLRGDSVLGVRTSEECRDQGLHKLGLMPFDAAYPPGMISLTAGREATFWIIDADEGMYYDELPIYAEFMNFETVAVPRAGYWEPRGEQVRYGYTSYPLTRGVSIVIPGDQPPDGMMVSHLLQKYGWPDSFRRIEYLDAVQKEREAAMDAATHRTRCN
ncbi:hypothetical protein PG996_013617 [Apiospora saccharicola]|uniref:Uncharacterized protein n=1 Tax=Apiospora saccharicola TaxID=335842 RepID=A0ABR1U5Z3_9PEZI